MDKIVCIRHPKYEGNNPPDLSCKLCCTRYVDRIKAQAKSANDKNGFNAYRWLQRKSKKPEQGKSQPAMV